MNTILKYKLVHAFVKASKCLALYFASTSYDLNQKDLAGSEEELKNRLFKNLDEKCKAAGIETLLRRNRYK